MKNDPRRRLLGLALCAAFAAPFGAQGIARAGDALELQQAGRLRVAVYRDFAPWAADGKGIDVALGRELARRLGLQFELAEFRADDDMDDDLRNMVWKGHYLGLAPGDVMLHVPVDQRFAERNDKVKIFGPYHLESVAIVRNPSRVPPVVGSAARALEVFTREKAGVETGSIGDSFLMGVLNGRLRENVTHFRSVVDAVRALRAGEVAAVMGTRTELESALAQTAPADNAASTIELSDVEMPELRVKAWPLGMAVKADHPALAEALTNAMIEMQRDGTVAKIFADHKVSVRTP